MHAYVWDRYYGICLAKYQHSDVVNSVAFNPRDSEMLVTTSDDYTIKVRLFLLFSDNLKAIYFYSFLFQIRFGVQSIVAVN